MSQFRATHFNQPPHIMPTPSSLPFNINAMPWAVVPTGLVEFNAPQFDINGKKCFAQFKRKSDTVPDVPTKQLITEEKMAAHLNGLHISNDYISHNVTPSTSSGITDFSMGENQYEYSIHMTQKDLEEKLKNASRITICEEIKKLNQDESNIPKLLLARLEKPCTALVLWQAPQKLTNLIVPIENSVNKNDEDEEQDNNNSSNIDFNNSMELDL